MRPSLASLVVVCTITDERPHCSQFRESLPELEKTEDPSNGVVATLSLLCRLYGAWAIEENAQYFLKFGFYSPAQMDDLSAEVNELCAILRKCAVPLVDAFNYTDHIVSPLARPSPRLESDLMFVAPQVNSPLGVHSGDVYKVYFDRVRASNPHLSVHPCVSRYSLHLSPN